MDMKRKYHYNVLSRFVAAGAGAGPAWKIVAGPFDTRLEAITALETMAKAAREVAQTDLEVQWAISERVDMRRCGAMYA